MAPVTFTSLRPAIPDGLGSPTVMETSFGSSIKWRTYCSRVGLSNADLEGVVAGLVDAAAEGLLGAADGLVWAAKESESAKVIAAA